MHRCRNRIGSHRATAAPHLQLKRRIGQWETFCTRVLRVIAAQTTKARALARAIDPKRLNRLAGAKDAHVKDRASVTARQLVPSVDGFTQCLLTRGVNQEVVIKQVGQCQGPRDLRDDTRQWELSHQLLSHGCGLGAGQGGIPQGMSAQVLGLQGIRIDQA